MEIPKIRCGAPGYLRRSPIVKNGRTKSIVEEPRRLISFTLIYTCFHVYDFHLTLVFLNISTDRRMTDEDTSDWKAMQWTEWEAFRFGRSYLRRLFL